MSVEQCTEKRLFFITFVLEQTMEQCEAGNTMYTITTKTQPCALAGYRVK